MTNKPLPPKILTISNSPEAQKKFVALARAQRDLPEAAMLKIQRHLGGGVLSYLVEHVGDLSHRVSQSVYHDNITAALEDITPKIRKAIEILESEYGFLREHEENIVNNHESTSDYINSRAKTFDEFTSRILNPLREAINKDQEQLTSLCHLAEELNNLNNAGDETKEALLTFIKDRTRAAQAKVSLLKHMKQGCEMDARMSADDPIKLAELTQNIDQLSAELAEKEQELASRRDYSNFDEFIHVETKSFVKSVEQKITTLSGGIEDAQKSLDNKTKELANSINHTANFEAHLEQTAGLRETHLPLHEHKLKLEELLKNYSSEHAKLPVYNEVQRLCRDAAIHVGRLDITMALECLKDLKAITDTPELYEEVASKYDPEFEKNTAPTIHASSKVTARF